MYDELSQKFRPSKQIVSVQAQYEAATYNSTSDNSLTAEARPPVEYVIYKEGVSHFKADMPTSQPPKRNQEVELWLRQIENATL